MSAAETGEHVDPDGAWPKPRVAWYAVGVLCAAYAIAILDRTVLSLLVIPIERDLGINDTQMGLLTGLSFGLFYATLGIPIGWLADRRSRRDIIGIGITLWSIATAACGLANSYVHLFFARMMVGVGEATLAPAASSMISDLFSPKDRPRAFGVYVMGSAFGIGLASLMGALVIGALAATPEVTVPIVGTIRSWQAVFFVVGIPGLVVAALLMTIPEPIRRGKREDNAKASFADVLAFMARNKLAFAVAMLGPLSIIMAIYGSIGWSATFFIRAHGWTAPEYGAYSAIFGTTAGIISALGSGQVTTWFAKRDPHTAPLYTLLIGVIGSGLFHFLMPHMPGGELAFIMNLCGSLFANFPPAAAYTMLNQITPNEMRAQVTAIYNLIIGLAGLTLGALIVGALTDYVFRDPKLVGFSLGYTYLGCAVVGTVLILFGKNAFAAASRAATWNQQS